MNKVWQFDALLQNDKWLESAFVEVDSNGIIIAISDACPSSENLEKVNGFALPGYQNAHSHAFQYAMAGTTEHLPHGAKSDDFWSWREAMYALALNISPPQMKTIASMLYSEMVRHGYTSVAEFHYLHHDKDGGQYANLAEMGEQLVIAAEEAGIKITLVPIFYQMGGFNKAPNKRQRRFICKTVDDYQNLWEKSKQMVARYSHAKLGIGVHSLRAVCPKDIIHLLENAPRNTPCHIHVSEQEQEVADSIAYLKKRPVAWLLDNVSLDENYHLVHATHLKEYEIDGIIDAKANVVLCPSTEGNLGDGFFPLKEYWNKGGRWSIGTDSHIGISLTEELRILDYGQRLKWRQRNILCRHEGEDSAQNAFTQSLVSGRKAMGNREDRFFAVGQAFDAVIINAKSPILARALPQYRLASIIYTSDSHNIMGTLINGKWMHNKSEKIKKAFREMKL